MKINIFFCEKKYIKKNFFKEKKVTIFSQHTYENKTFFFTEKSNNATQKKKMKKKIFSVRKKKKNFFTEKK